MCNGVGQASGYPCKDVHLQSILPLSTFDDTLEVNDVWGWTHGVREFSIVGLYDGMGFVEITEPTNPMYLGKVKGDKSMFRDVKVYKNYALMVSEAENHGMYVFDLERLLDLNPSSPQRPRTLSADASFHGFDIAHNLVVNEDTGYVYAVGSDKCDGGLYMIDMRSPLSPVFAGCFGDEGYTHDAHCVVYHGPDPIYQGKEICFCSNEDTVTIVDVTTKSNPRKLSSSRYALDAYTHQGWLTEDHAYFIFTDEYDEYYYGHNTRTLVLDVQSLSRPTMAGQHFGTTTAVDHNVYNKEGFSYIANYRGGLRILRIEDVSTAKFSEIGYFDTYPANDKAEYNGAWSVYPYFRSGNVVVSSIEAGLFVLRPDLTAEPVCNRNGICDPGENCNNCSEDCVSYGIGYCCNGDISPDCGHASCSCALAQPPVLSGTSRIKAEATRDNSRQTDRFKKSALSSPQTCISLDNRCRTDDSCCSGACTRGRCVGQHQRRLGEPQQNSGE